MPSQNSQYEKGELMEDELLRLLLTFEMIRYYLVELKTMAYTNVCKCIMQIIVRIAGCSSSSSAEKKQMIRRSRSYRLVLVLSY